MVGSVEKKDHMKKPRKEYSQQIIKDPTCTNEKKNRQKIRVEIGWKPIYGLKQ